MADSSSPNRKTNVLLLASSLWIGGAETVIRHLAETVDRRRFNVSVAYLKQRGHIGQELERAGIDVVGVDSGSAKVDYLSFRKLLRVLRSRKIDVVHTHTTHGLVDATLCKLFMPRLKVLHTFHFGNYPHTRTRILWMERIFSRLANRVFAVGEHQRRQLKKVHRFTDGGIGTVRNGVVPQALSNGQAFRHELGADGQIVVGTIATLIEQKGLPDLMKVAKRLRDAGADVRFVIVGEGVLRPELEAMRREMDLEGTVTITGWLTNAAQVALPAFDIFFQPSLWEAMSVVVLEAMAAAKPVVATRVGENPLVIDDGTDGILVDAGDVDGMAAALMRLVGDACLRERMGQAARQKVEQQFTVAHMTRAYEEIYLDVQR